MAELTRLFKSRKTVPAEAEFLDFPGSIKTYTGEKAAGAAQLLELAQMDGLVYVVRVFSQASVPHEAGTLDPWRDLETIEFELAFADMVLMDKRLERIRDSAGKAKAQDREAMERDRVLLTRLKDNMEKGVPVRDQELNEDEEKALRSYQFLTSRPTVTVLNIGEEDIERSAELEIEARRRLGPQAGVVAASCQIEMEISELEPAEAEEFRANLGIHGSPVQRLMDVCHAVTNRIHFLTTGEDETRAWPVPRGATALQAAGAIHSDLERGFIRAEVISYEDLVKIGSLTESKKRGLLRSEGKTYVVQDGDVVNILFHI